MEYRNSREFPREFLDSEIPENSRTGIPGGLDGNEDSTADPDGGSLDDD